MEALPEEHPGKEIPDTAASPVENSPDALLGPQHGRRLETSPVGPLDPVRSLLNDFAWVRLLFIFFLVALMCVLGVWGWG